jgi:hypothetical protein
MARVLPEGRTSPCTTSAVACRKGSEPPAPCRKKNHRDPGVEPDPPVAHDLRGDAADPGRIRARTTIGDLGQLSTKLDACAWKRAFQTLFLPGARNRCSSVGRNEPRVHHRYYFANINKE